jgi:hypothetical protein
MFQVPGCATFGFNTFNGKLKFNNGLLYNWDAQDP